jgi:divalent metal cation (Fe/Co/Zn/Cd) transporter
MDRIPGTEVVADIRRAAEAVPQVLAVEKLLVRGTGMTRQVAIHVHADPAMTLAEAHALGGRVKAAIRAAVPRVDQVLVHMEPYAPEPAAGGLPGRPERSVTAGHARSKGGSAQR